MANDVDHDLYLACLIAAKSEATARPIYLVLSTKSPSHSRGLSTFDDVGAALAHFITS